MQIFSFSPFGYEGSLVSVEVDLRRGIPAVDVVGLADGAVKESRERMRSAIRNCGFEFPPERVLISLSPADVRKEGAGFDLAIALAVLEEKMILSKKEKCADSFKDVSELVTDKLAADESVADLSVAGGKRSEEKVFDSGAAGNAVVNGTENADEKWLPDGFVCERAAVLVMGELELNGKVRPVRGIHGAVSTALEAGIRLCIVPSANANEAREVKGMKVFGAENLTDAFEALNSREAFMAKSEAECLRSDLSLPEGYIDVNGVLFPAVEDGFDFSEIHGQKQLIRGLQIAAAGGHNLLAFGPPGCGKTLALQRFYSLLPLLTLEEAQPVTRIYSLAGLLAPGSSVIRKVPFRMPHQTATIEGMCGGGTHLSPGEISLAHNGVLFLDEAAEFRSSVLQMLRVPLENGSVTLSRAGRSTVFPAQFQLLMATNPCPCGNYGFSEKICLCSAKSVELYWKKFSGPLLDRIDIRIQVETGNSVSWEKENHLSSAQLREDIGKALKIQRKRQGKRNARLSPSEIALYCHCTDEAKCILDSASEHYGFSPRAVSSCIKLSRTIADMRESEMIEGIDMEEAVIFRKTDGGLL